MGKMIGITRKEWKKYKDDWAANKPAGTKVVVYDRPMVYNKKRSAITVYGKFELSEGGVWIRV